MIEIGKLTDSDIGRRLTWEVAPGIENPAQLAAWTDTALVLFMPATKHKGLHPVFDVDPSQVKWAERLSLSEFLDK